MMRGLWNLTWLETKIFVREPLGFIGTVGFPVLIFIVLGRVFGRAGGERPRGAPNFVSVDLPILVTILMALSAVLSLVTIIAIYREGGHPEAAAGDAAAAAHHPDRACDRQAAVHRPHAARDVPGWPALLPGRRSTPPLSFALALLFSTLSIVSMGFLIASIVPTARFAQPIGSLILYPMLGLSGLFVPIESLPPALQGVGSRSAADLRGIAAARHLARRRLGAAYSAILPPSRSCSIICTARLGQSVSLGIAPRACTLF